MSKAFSLVKGYTFTFEDEGSSIDAWFSALSGLEKIYVNGELLSSQRNLSINSSHSFNIGANRYSTQFKVKSLLKGPFICTLNKNGQAYKQQNLVFHQPKPLLSVMIILLCIALSVLFGFAKAHWSLPAASAPLFTALIALILISYRIKSYRQPTLERVDLVISAPVVARPEQP